ncbi:MAG: hypothetical protein AAF849_01855 [Bacteroidota bacterium]
MKSFKYWTRQDLFKKFGLEQLYDCSLLDEWIGEMNETLGEEEISFLNKNRQRLVKYIDIWNEQELSINFIGPIITEIDFYTKHTKFFYGRRLVGKINGEEIGGYIDGMISEGKYAPEKPYFCLHEYKYEEGSSNDGTGQLVIAMYLAKQINRNNLPLYGAYVSGRSWYFVTLTDEGYCKSEVYTATKELDLQQIYLILKRLKNISVELAMKHQALQAT